MVSYYTLPSYEQATLAERIACRLCYFVNHAAILRLSQVSQLSDNAREYIVMTACEYGIPILIRRFQNNLTSAAGMKLARYMHFDLIQEVRTLIVRVEPTFGLTVADAMYTTSLPVMLYMRQHHPRVLLNLYEPLRQVMRNCYVYGFDRELLEYATSEEMSPPGIGNIVCIGRHYLHPSAPETLRYLINRYPGFYHDYTTTSTLLSCIQREHFPEQYAEMRDILIAAGVQP